MNLVRFSPYRSSFPTALNRFFYDDFVTPSFKDMVSNTPAVNVKEDDKGFNIEVAVPGFKKEDFTIELTKGQLVIAAEVTTEQGDKKEKYTRKEFNSQSFRRVFKVPEVVDSEQIDASYENGILHINLPKKEAAIADQSKVIAIQ